jgi:hypothetical protein
MERACEASGWSSRQGSLNIMAGTKKAAQAPSGDGNPKSSGKGGGKSLSGGADPGRVEKTARGGERPSPSDRQRCETSTADGA